MAAKKLNLIAATGLTVYAIIAREADGYYLNDADGSFAAAPADPYLSLTENGTANGLYQVSESRATWTDGRYLVVYYSRLGGAPAPATDTILGGGVVDVLSDGVVLLGIAETGVNVLRGLMMNLRASVLRLPDGLVSDLAPSFEALRNAILDLQQSILRGR